MNPSFEDRPTCCQPPKGWTDCGFRGETPPDVQPALNSDSKPFFNVTQKAFDGETYLGMVVRENATYERVTQQLEKPLRIGRCYSFSMMLCRSITYLSASNKNNPNILRQFTDPVVLRIWGADSICVKNSLLYTTEPIENTDWVKYDFQFKTVADLNYILLEAFYSKNNEWAYNGNVLLDNASDIIEIDCDSLIKK
jgi:hypothetical protein